MKRTLLALAASAMMTTSVMAENIGVSMAYFDDNFLTILRNAMGDEAASAGGVEIQFEDARGDIGKQIDQVQNFVAQGVDAIIVNPADTSATPRITKLANSAGIPLVYVNRKPEDKELPEKVVFVGSDEVVAGRLQMEELAKQMGGKGNVAIMLGELASNGTRGRTQGVKEVLGSYPDITVVEEQTADFQRSEAIDLMNNWIVSGTKIDAVAANNDEMALGALIAMKQAGIAASDIAVAGVDATPDALASMKRGQLFATVFQDAKGQGAGSVKAALKLARGEKVDTIVWIPFKLVNKANLGEFLNK
ncbi:sugar ABC transporter substrate-binding protein [Pseudovibrio sp. WM33]|uniref:sugar ABC transporter substrate-binding protein n=1 Tax=Pseudovibrio sp. WM33 TaxID=1735585 RepID=UPI0007AE53ED|nr:sugar ABC transporter substrate-binding protein [Pseudovibrio sp. WM33]KZL26222.1 D-galactose-binding periplasmic protein precursor [Pseudovibrio sp. WM33]